MTLITRRRALLTVGALTLAGSPVLAASPVYTTIVVHNMHCQNCANKIARKLYAVPGVVEVRAEVPKNAAYVVPQNGKALSSRRMWEAVEAAGFKVVSLSGPEGSFTSKPR